MHFHCLGDQWDKTHHVNIILLLERWSGKGPQWHGEDSALHIHCSNLPEDRASSQYDSFTWIWPWKAILWWSWGWLCMFIVQLSKETELQVGGVQLWRYSWRGHSSVTLAKMVFKWAFLVMLERNQLCTSIVQVSQDRSSNWYKSFTWNMVLKRMFGDTGEDPALDINYSGLQGDRALSQWNSFPWNMVLKRPFITDWGRLSSTHSLFRLPRGQSVNLMMIVLLRRWFWKGHSLATLGKHVHHSGFMGDRPLSQYYSFTQEMVLQGQATQL